jgi:alpha-ketoglutarate-dependent taurine dioxygenase
MISVPRPGPAALEVVTAPGRTPVAEVAAEDPAAWAARHRAEVREAVLRHGALLLRGLDVTDVAGADRVSRALLDTRMPEREGFAPRDVLADRLYSASHWPTDQPMCMHHELSYASWVPGLLVLTCLRPPEDGGATALADARQVLSGLPPALADRFDRLGWQLTRSFTDLVGVSTADAFGSADRHTVERYCADNAIELDWTGDGGARTRQRRPAIVRHPVTGDRCWFNQIAFLSEWTMAAEVREYLYAEFGGAAGLPFNTFDGAGDPVDEATVAVINDEYDRHTVREPWRRGDVLVVDNILTAHSREPYSGAREIVVVMGEPLCISDLS